MENGGSHALGGEDGWEQNLMWDIPSAPNNGRYCLAERFLGGHTLVAVGVGKRLMVMTKENFGVSSPNPNTSSPFARSENAAPWMPLWGGYFHRDPPEFRVGRNGAGGIYTPLWVGWPHAAQRHVTSLTSAPLVLGDTHFGADGIRGAGRELERREQRHPAVCGDNGKRGGSGHRLRRRRCR